MNSPNFDRRTVGLLVGVFVAAVVITWLVSARQRPATPVSAATPIPTAPSASANPEAVAVAAATPTASGPELVVEVVGKVRRPAVVTLPAGSRVLDAVEAAGGVKSGVDTTDQNLARPLVDGEQIRIGLEPAPAAVDPAGNTAAGSPVNINSASADALQLIPGVGPVLAQRIILYREQNGAFTTVEQLLEVSGIGEATFQQMQPLVTVGAGG